MARIVLSVMLLAVALQGAVAGAGAQDAERLTGSLYALGSKDLLYRWEMHLEPDRWRSWFYAPDGKVAAEDETLWKNGELQAYRYRRYTTGESSSVERRGGTLVYTRNMDGKRDQSVEKYDPAFTVGATVIRYVQARWDALLKGSEFKIRYGVLDQLDSFGFELERDRKHPRNAPDRVVIRMRASSAFIRLFVDPIYFVFSEDGSVLYQMSGRTLPMERDGKALRPIDGDLKLRVEP